MNILTELRFVKPVEEAGGKVYLVGGYVRDHLMGRESKDIDVLVTGIPEDELFFLLCPYGKIDVVGQSFGVIKLTTEEHGVIDIALPRTELKIGEGHTGFRVTVDHTLPVETDLARRDFTMNAIAMDSEGEYIDPFGGISDIEKKRIHTVSDISFQEDPLRILRAIQFAARFDFYFSPSVVVAMAKHAKLLKEITGERVHMEFEKLIKGNAYNLIPLMKSLGITDALYTQIERKYEVAPKLKKINSIPELLYSMYGTCADYYIRNRFKLTVAEEKEGMALSSVMLTPTKWTIFGAGQLWKGLYSSEFFKDTFVQGYINKFNDGTYPKKYKDLDITSEELIDLGYEGAALGDIYKTIVRAILSGTIGNIKDEIIELVRKRY